MLQPLRDLVMITRLEGHGIEEITAGGIVLPATREKSVRTKGDYFRARVDGIGPRARYAEGELSVGDEVFVYTYSGTAESVFTGVRSGAHEFVRPEDILCVVEAA